MELGTTYLGNTILITDPTTCLDPAGLAHGPHMITKKCEPGCYLVTYEADKPEKPVIFTRELMEEDIVLASRRWVTNRTYTIGVWDKAVYPLVAQQARYFKGKIKLSGLRDLSGNFLRRISEGAHTGDAARFLDEGVLIEVCGKRRLPVKFYYNSSRSVVKFEIATEDGKRRGKMNLSDLKFEKIENYDPLNSRAKNNGMVSEWVARNMFGNAVAFGNTKAECQADARRFLNMENAKKGGGRP